MFPLDVCVLNQLILITNASESPTPLIPQQSASCVDHEIKKKSNHAEI